MARGRYLISLAVLLLAPALHAQQWAGILNSGRAVDWTQAVGVPGGIPNYSTQCGSTINTATTTYTAINAAIAACPNGDYVLLNSGTVTLSGTIQMGTHGVVLRGSGPTHTVLKWSGTTLNCGDGQVCGIAIGPVGVYDGSAAVQPGGSNALALTGTVEGGAGVFPWGATHITVGTVGSDHPPVGTLLMMDQVNDAAVAPGVLQGDNPNVVSSTSLGGNGGAFGRPGTGACCYVANKRSQVQVVIITACTPSCSAPTGYTIFPGIYFNNIRTSQVPGAWWNFSGSKVTGAGVENLTVDETGPSMGQGITFTNAYQSWVKGVRFVCLSTACPRDHIASVQSLEIEMSDSYLFGAQAGGGSEGYGYEGVETSGCLIENNIWDQNIAPWINAGVTGCVFGYNFSWNNITAGPTFMQGSYTSHDAGNGMNLFEGNDLNGIFADNQHGAAPLYAEFRNKLMGNQPVPYNHTAQQTFAVNEDSYNRVGSFIGNVLGSITCVGGTYNGLPADENSQCTGGSATGASYHTVYEASPAVGTTGCNSAIFSFGFGNGDGCTNPGPSGAAAGNDLEVGTSMMRWGNCDTVTNSCRFNSSEVPTAGGTYYIGTSVPASHTLPASFYYTSQPAWYVSAYGTPPWPPIGPDVTGGDLATLPSGHAYRNPARLCFENTAQDATNYPSTAVRAFDASVCYAGGAGGSVTVAPTLVSFDNVVVGQTSSPQIITLTNGTFGSISATGVNITGANAGDFGYTTTCSGIIGASSTCTVTVTFAPSFIGTESASVAISYTGSTGSPVSASLTGNGVSNTTAPAGTMFSSNTILRGAVILR